MIEGSGSIPLTSGTVSGSGKLKNMWIRWIRNTGRYRIFCGHMKRRPQLDRNDYVIVTNRRNFGANLLLFGCSVRDASPCGSSGWARSDPMTTGRMSNTAWWRDHPWTNTANTAATGNSALKIPERNCFLNEKECLTFFTNILIPKNVKYITYFSRDEILEQHF